MRNGSYIEKIPHLTNVECFLYWSKQTENVQYLLSILSRLSPAACRERSFHILIDPLLHFKFKILMIPHVIDGKYSLISGHKTQLSLVSEIWNWFSLVRNQAARIRFVAKCLLQWESKLLVCRHRTVFQTINTTDFIEENFPSITKAICIYSFQM